MTDDVRETMLGVFRTYLGDLKDGIEPEDAIVTAWNMIKDDEEVAVEFVRTAFGAIANEMDKNSGKAMKDKKNG